MTIEDTVITGWDLQSLRATTFHPLGSSPIEDAQLWDDVVGERPLTVDSRPREGFARHVGELGDHQLMMVARADRIDWVLQPVPAPPSQPTATPPTFGSESTALRSFQGLVGKWLAMESCPEITRLAFGAVMFSPVEDMESGLSELLEYTPLASVYSPECEDFLYQINRPRYAQAVQDVKINRLTKWSIMQFELISMEIAPGSQHIATTSSGLARRLEVDINTSTSIEPIVPKEGSATLFEELVRLGLEIAKEGDIE